MSREAENWLVTDVLYYLSTFRNEKYPNGIVISRDIGTHGYCHMDTNCPEAVYLRKVMADAGVTFDDISTIAPEEQPQHPIRVNIPDVSGKTMVMINGIPVDVDIGDDLKIQLDQNMHRKYLEFENFRETASSILNDLYATYVHHTLQTFKKKGLPMITTVAADLIKYRCMITSSSDKYYYIFSLHYAPEYIVGYIYDKEGGGAVHRYRISKEYQDKIIREVFLVYPIFLNKQIEVPFLLGEKGGKFQHYHGAGRDCWGNVEIPQKWDGRLQSLYDITRQIEGTLKTINRDSLMSEHPPGMPNFVTMFNASTDLGIEGKYEKGSSDKDIDIDSPVNVKDRKQWGVEVNDG